MSKHTPGPWQTVTEGHRLSVWAEGHGFVHTSEVPQVNIGATKTANANARLIAAAPEMLDVLRVALADIADMEFNHVWDSDDEHPVDCRYCLTRKKINAVIEKVEGGA